MKGSVLRSIPGRGLGSSEGMGLEKLTDFLEEKRAKFEEKLEELEK